MKGPLITLFFLSVILVTANAQQLGVYTIYRDQFQMINPAAINHMAFVSVGHANNTMINTAYRRQWLNVQDAPMSFNARVEHFPASQDFKVGAFYSMDAFFASTEHSFFLNAAKIFKLSGTRNRGIIRNLAIGLNLGLMTQSFDLDKVSFATPDPAKSRLDNRYYADVAMGLFYWANGKNDKYMKYYLGLSSLQTYPQLLNDSGGQFGNRSNDRVVHWYGIAGLWLPVGKEGFLEPSIWVRHIQNSSFVTWSASGLNAAANLNIRYRYLQDRYNTNKVKQGYWFGAGVSTAKEINGEAGFIMEDGSERAYKFGLAAIVNTQANFGLGPSVEFTFSVSL